MSQLHRYFLTYHMKCVFWSSTHSMYQNTGVHENTNTPCGIRGAVAISCGEATAVMRQVMYI